MQSTIQQEDFWLGRYRGHTLAVLRHRSGWLVYLDHVLQHRLVFETSEAAVAWLRRRIDVRSLEHCSH
jgi:hypothetical protein